MSLASDLITALGEFNLPVYQNQYTGDQSVYFVFNIGEIPQDFADDYPQHERALIQLHLFAPISLNTTAMRAGIKGALVDAGFDYPSVTDASDEDGQHLVFETGCAYGSNG